MATKTTTADLIIAIADKTGLARADVARAMTALTSTITESLADGSAVTVVNLGTFKRTHRVARPGRNPATGEPIQIAASNSAGFSPAKTLKDALN